MSPTTIENIYNDYRTAGKYSPDYALDFFAKNVTTLNNPDTFKDDGELKLYIELLWQHLNALYQKDRYNDTADNAIKYLYIIDSKINQHRQAFIKDDWYYGILLFKGMATYQLRDYKASSTIFKELTEHDPKNENYKKWLSYSTYGLHMWISKTITVVCGVLLLIEIFFKKYIPSFFLNISLDGIALIGLTGTLIYDYYIKRSFRKSNQK
jgi:hypothetical protein